MYFLQHLYFFRRFSKVQIEERAVPKWPHAGHLAPQKMVASPRASIQALASPVVPSGDRVPAQTPRLRMFCRFVPDQAPLPLRRRFACNGRMVRAEEQGLFQTDQSRPLPPFLFVT